MLLIDDHQPEIEELHALTEQGMRADDNVSLPVDCLQQGCPALLRRHRSRQQSYSHCYSGLLQHRCQRSVVLLGQDFRRRQHRALPAGIDCLQHSQ